MNRASRLAIIGAIMLKDVRALSRDVFWAGITVVSLIAYPVVFLFLPDEVEESITVGIRQSDLPLALGAFGAMEKGLELVEFDTAEQLRAAVAGEGDEEAAAVDVGLAFPDGFLRAARAGEATTVEVFVNSEVPLEIRGVLSSGLREMVHAIGTVGRGGMIEEAFPVTWPEFDTVVLGEDRMGKQVPFRDRIRPLIAFFVLLVESLALAGLVAVEVQSGTVHAILVTPARPADVLLAKGLLGTLLAFSQAAIVLALIGAFSGPVLLPLVVVLLGAAMMAGIGLIAGSAGKDFLGTMMYAALFLVPLMIPTIAALFPGTASGGVRILPSYGVIEGLIATTAYGAGFTEILPHLAAAGAWVGVLFGSGLVVLRRKVTTR